MDKCGKCGTELSPANRDPCPKCGATNRILIETVSEIVIVHNGFKLRQKRNGYTKFLYEELQGLFASVDPKLKKGIDETRTIDKEKDEYNQVVINSLTGEIIHEEHEPLSKHRSKRINTNNKISRRHYGQQRQKERQETQGGKSQGR
jgi:hypothetical protein